MKIIQSRVTASLLGLLAWSVISCNDNVISTPRNFATVDEAEARWKAHNIKSYTISQRRSCFCAPLNYPLTLQVDSGGKIVTARDTRGATIETRFGTSIEQMFTAIRQLQTRSDASFTVKYDSIYGYPRTLNADPIKLAADDEYSLETTLVR